MKKVYEVVVDQRSVVFDKVVLIVEAESEAEAIHKCQYGEYDDIDSEEMDRDHEETYWNDVVVEELHKEAQNG